MRAGVRVVLAAQQTMPRDRIVIGTRGSLLALTQTRWVVDAIARLRPDLQVRIEAIRTTGDQRDVEALPEIGRKGLFTYELEQALLAGRIDLAVHSAKDLPTDSPAELDLLLVPPREDPRDALVSRDRCPLRQLPAGAVVGTSSLRRQAQLLLIRRDLQFVTLRGNVDTRVRKVHAGQCRAAVLALAGLRRAGLEGHVTERLEAGIMVPAPGQGTLAVQGRRDDHEIRAMLAPLEDADARLALDCERRIVGALGGGCRTPIGVWVRPSATGWEGDAVVLTPDASRVARASVRRDDADWAALADELVEELRRKDADSIIAGSRTG